MRVGKRTTMPVGSRTGHRQNEPVRTRCDIPSSPYNTIATQQRTNETIVRAARIYFIKIYSSIFIKNTINYQTFNLFTSRSPHTRRNPGVFSSPCRATEHTIDKAFAPDTRNASGSARPGGFCVEPATGIPLIPCPSRPSPGRIEVPDRAGRIPMKFLSYGHVLIQPPQDMPGNDHRETEEREIRT